MKKEWKPNQAEQMVIDQCIANDRKAQYQIYQQYSKAMFNICVRMLNDTSEAEDALQESFLKAFRNMEQFKGNSTLGAWLKRIVVNECLNRIKKRKLDLISIEDRQLEESAEDEHLSEQDLVLEVGKVRQAIQELPDGFRVVFSLYLIEGYDHQEIADILGITESTSKSQYSRAKAKLRQLLTA